MSNKSEVNNLNKARQNKNDEFYTQYEDIEKEVNRYLDYNPDCFKDKIVLCPCDDPNWSNFTKFFAQNFTKLGLKKLICTSYAKGNKKFSKLIGQNLDETKSDLYNADKNKKCGKVFILENSKSDKCVSIDDISFHCKINNLAIQLAMVDIFNCGCRCLCNRSTSTYIETQTLG